MSRAIGPYVEYRCTNDCRQEGCPGHKVREIFDRATDYYIFEFTTNGSDNISYHSFDENAFIALLKAHELARGV